MRSNRICKLFGIRYPIIQAGMVWCSGWKLAAAVSKKGGLGIIGAGSMYPEVLRQHIQRLRAATDKPFAVNVPLLYPDIDQHMAVIEAEQVPIVFTSAGNPATWTGWLKERGIVVVHVVPNVSLARKCEQRGVDAVVCEGFEAGGHNGKDEITTLCLIPQAAEALQIPVIAAGGIGDGRAVAAAFALGAEAVQIGSRFAATLESSAHENFKEKIVEADDRATVLCMKDVVPVRLIKNAFYEKIQAAENRCAPPDEIRAILGKRRAKAGIFEGDLVEGELEIGQISGLIRDIPSAADLFDRLLQEYQQSVAGLPPQL
ncbi:enoyl-[acyl-carrier protein] reductase II [Cyclonatronum proteinivorum]|uniref:Enoyl-[acyl-carrier protein] reductase II n=1 Tax=Cyclonatronum proteinivorum TaxID=1457365 RepID=A0A345UKV9_9BACT|nr:nitronate monooxygenase [Cyclonatronum proteinivorum]AXJ01111.1 enoyl-[acyl-carrier protein] reductase II [Cyclonatronum proteinivorum]